MLRLFSPTARLDATRELAHLAGELFQLPISLRLWDGSVVPLGPEVHPDYFVSISGPGVLGSLLRRPTLENLLIHYAKGRLGVHGGDLMALGELAREKAESGRVLRRRLRAASKSKLFRSALPLLFTPANHANLELGYARDETGRKQERDDKDFVQFHYDLGNEFYALFLDPEMIYSCAYFEDWSDALEKAQQSKLEHICRKLRLQAGDTLLDIGCGWGALICYAAQNYGVNAHGVTLSEEQASFARQKIERLGLQDQVRVELKDYREVEGTYDKIASIGMYEHVGIAGYPAYFRKLKGLLRDGGLVLNHGITRRAMKDAAKFLRISPGRRVILKYIFPGSELDHVGHTVEVMEASGLEVRDVEGLREHYALTARHWCKRLAARQDEAISLIGAERYRLWAAYLAGVSFSFTDGSLRVFQVVASKGLNPLAGHPPTRRHLYREA